MAPIEPDTGIDEIPDSMLAEYHLERGGARFSAYRYHAPNRVLIPLGELRLPTGRALDPARLRRILEAVAARDPLPAVPVFCEGPPAGGLDLIRRVAVAAAPSFVCLACAELTLGDSRAFGRDPAGQR